MNKWLGIACAAFAALTIAAAGYAAKQHGIAAAHVETAKILERRSDSLADLSDSLEVKAKSLEASKHRADSALAAVRAHADARIRDLNDKVKAYELHATTLFDSLPPSVQTAVRPIVAAKDSAIASLKTSNNTLQSVVDAQRIDILTTDSLADFWKATADSRASEISALEAANGNLHRAIDALNKAQAPSFLNRIVGNSKTFGAGVIIGTIGGYLAHR